jgi:hypothetical protein
MFSKICFIFFTQLWIFLIQLFSVNASVIQLEQVSWAQELMVFNFSFVWQP